MEYHGAFIGMIPRRELLFIHSCIRFFLVPLNAVGIRLSSSSDHMAVLFTDDDSAKDGYVNGVS